MASLARPEVTQFGFTNGGGALANICDGDLDTFWSPLPDGFDGYPVPPVGDSGLVIPGNAHPCIQFFFGEFVRIPIFRVKVETPASLGRCWLIASNSPATSVLDSVQSSDVNAGGYYTVAQMNSGAPLETKAKTQDIRRAFWRFVFWQQPPAA